MQCCRSTLALSLKTLVSRQSYKNGRAISTAVIQRVSVANRGLAQMDTLAVAGHRSRRKEGDEFLTDILPKLMRPIYDSYADRQSPVIEFLQPEELKEKLDFELRDEPINNEQLEELARRAIKYSMKTGHPYFFNQLFGGVDAFALSGSIINEALNSTAYTYEIAPVVSLIEQEFMSKFATEYIRYPKGQEDGIFCPGGSAANMYGLSLARHHRFPESKTKGMQGIPRVHVYTSTLSHYSLKKAAFFMGLGLDNVIHIETDSAGRMLPEKLDKAIQDSKSKGYEPLMVNATSGTTVRGAYDPIEPIADICAKHGNVWLHIDACWGGAALLSPKLRHKLKGIERSDSVAWDPHKMAGAILQCAPIITKHKGLLAEAHSANARYLFQQDKIYDCSLDSGDKSVQCGRKIDAFKIWMLWKAYGSRGMAERIEECFRNADYLRQKLKETPGFRLLFEEQECTNTCFWYIPPSLRGQEENDEWWQKLSLVAPKIKGQMQTTGSMMIGYQPEGNYVNFFRMVVASAMSTREDMDEVIQVIQRFGEDL